jgi:putative lipoprotein
MVGDGTTSEGGGALGGRFVVTMIAGEATIDPKPTIELTDGHVGGHGSVNRYRGSYEVVGDALVVGPVMSTMMAGPEPAMRQEQRWFAALAAPLHIGRSDADTVVLVDDQGSTTELSAVPTGPLVVVGVVTYVARIAMPQGAVVTVTLEDVSRADADAVVVARQVIVEPGNVPVAFSLAVDIGAVDERARLALRARIDVDGSLWYVSDTAHPVSLAELGDGHRHELVLVPAQR